MMPFPGGIEAVSNGTLIFSAGAAVFYFTMLEREQSLRRSAVKTLAVAFLALLAVLENGPLLLVAALAASALGDAFLSREGEPAFLGGLASFLVAHLLFAALFLATSPGAGATMLETPRLAILAVMVVATGWLAFRLRAAAPNDLRLPVTVYAAAILGMGIASLAVPGPWVVLGAVSFMASDALLGIEKFLVIPNGVVRIAMRYAVWVLYYLAQVLITLGILLGDA